MALQNLGNVNFKSSLPLLAGAAVFFASAMYLHGSFKRPDLQVSKQASAVNINTMFLKMLSMGNKRLIADTLWIQTLLESDLEAYRGDPLNNWMYLRFKSIADLDPKFYENYLFGGQYLYIVKDDVLGGAEIMEQGLKLYPDDYRLNFNQGFNHYFEMDEIEKGLYHLEKVKDHPDAPKYISSLLIKLKHEINHDPHLTLSLLKEAHDKAKDPTLMKKLASDIYAIKAEIDLECLNKGKSDCDRLDAYGKPYVFREGSYQAPREFTPYKLHKRKKNSSK